MATLVLNEQMPDADLWEFVLQGNTAAFEVVVQRHQSLVCAVAYNSCGDLALSEDVAQEAFWTAWRERTSLENPSRLRAWLCGIARNLGHNARRRASSRPESAALDAAGDVPACGPSPVDEAVSHEEQTLVWQTLGRIPALYREPLILFYRQEHSVAEVAAALDISPDAVKQRLARGRGMLQERLAGLVEETLRRSRPGRGFTVGVMAGMVSLSAGSKTALAGIGLAGGAAPVVKAAGAGLAGGLFGAVLGPILGSLGGLLGGWLGTWFPAQFAATKPEREYLLRAGSRIFIVSVLFVAILTVPVMAFAGRLAVGAYLACLGMWFVAFWSYLGIEVYFISRTMKRLQAEGVGAEPNDAPLRVALEAVKARYRGRVFRSRVSLFGLPLVDIQVSDPQQGSGPEPAATEPRVARGWIAIGDRAYGVLFALGNRACGLIAVGNLALGLVALGGVLALGPFALGGALAVGVLAFGGGGAAGWQACGGGIALAWDMACGAIALTEHAAAGGVAVAQDYAVGGVVSASHVNDQAAHTVVQGYPLVSAFLWSLDNAIWMVPLGVATLLLLFGAMLLLMYKRERI